MADITWVHGVVVRQQYAVYWCPQLPEHFVAECSDAAASLQLFPAIAGGWDGRREYHGPRESLVLVSPETARLMVDLCDAGFDFMRAIERPWVATIRVPADMVRAEAARAG